LQVIEKDSKEDKRDNADQGPANGFHGCCPHQPEYIKRWRMRIADSG